MNCKNCQMPLPPDPSVSFCPNCGTILDQATSRSASPTAPAPSLTRQPAGDDDYATQFYNPQNPPAWIAPNVATPQRAASPPPAGSFQDAATLRGAASPPPAWAPQDGAATRAVSPAPAPSSWPPGGPGTPPTPQQPGQFYARSSLPTPQQGPGKQRRRG